MLNKFIKVDLLEHNRINVYVVENYLKLKLTLFIVPITILLAIVLFLYWQNALQVDQYIQIQKECFLFLNSKLSQFPLTQFNLTQFGDAIIFLSIVSIFFIYAPKIWESLLSASLVSCIFCTTLKKLFSVPRPAAFFDHDSFVIIGKTLTGHNSLPSGHSITVFTVLTVLLFAFVPKKLSFKILWYIFVIGTGLIFVFTRVGVGAHYPIDVITGSIIGYISGLLGIFISLKYPIWNWINNRTYYPIFILFFGICCFVLINKIMEDNLIIFYLSLTSLFVSLYKIIHVYVKK